MKNCKSVEVATKKENETSRVFTSLKDKGLTCTTTGIPIQYKCQDNHTPKKLILEYHPELPQYIPAKHCASGHHGNTGPCYLYHHGNLIPPTSRCITYAPIPMSPRLNGICFCLMCQQRAATITCNCQSCLSLRFEQTAASVLRPVDKELSIKSAACCNGVACKSIPVLHLQYPQFCHCIDCVSKVTKDPRLNNNNNNNVQVIVNRHDVERTGQALTNDKDHNNNLDSNEQNEKGDMNTDGDDIRLSQDKSPKGDLPTDNEQTQSSLQNNDKEQTFSSLSINNNELSHSHRVSENELSRHSHHVSENELSRHSHHVSENELSRHSHHVSENELSRHSHRVSENELSRHSHHVSENELSRHSHHVSENELSRHSHHVSENELSHHSHRVNESELTHHSHHVSENELRAPWSENKNKKRKQDDDILFVNKIIKTELIEEECKLEDESQTCTNEFENNILDDRNGDGLSPKSEKQEYPRDEIKIPTELYENDEGSNSSPRSTPEEMFKNGFDYKDDKSLIKNNPHSKSKESQKRHHNTRHTSTKTSFEKDNERPPKLKKNSEDYADMNKNLSRQRTKMNRLLANEHERRRVAQLNSAYQSLRQLIPGYQCDTKLPKIKILRYAINYIAHLDNVLETDAV